MVVPARAAVVVPEVGAVARNHLQRGAAGTGRRTPATTATPIVGTARTIPREGVRLADPEGSRASRRAGGARNTRDDQCCRGMLAPARCRARQTRERGRGCFGGGAAIEWERT